MIVLDLWSEVAPMYRRFQSFYGQPFIWCMLHNYGGNIYMYGVTSVVNQVHIIIITEVKIGVTQSRINVAGALYIIERSRADNECPETVNAWVDNMKIS